MTESRLDGVRKTMVEAVTPMVNAGTVEAVVTIGCTTGRRRIYPIGSFPGSPLQLMKGKLTFVHLSLFASEFSRLVLANADVTRNCMQPVIRRQSLYDGVSLMKTRLDPKRETFDYITGILQQGGCTFRTGPKSWWSTQTPIPLSERWPD
jgi:hypothetical protein